jgi:hypothetical protein
MKKFNSFQIYTVIFLIFFSANSYSQKLQDCRVFEFAEMQTMNQVELKELYCKNLGVKNLLDILKAGSIEAADQMEYVLLNTIRTGQKASQEAAQKHIDQYNNAKREYNRKEQICVAENNRILRLINKDKSQNIEPPTCN